MSVEDLVTAATDGATPNLSELLDRTASFFRRFVRFTDDCQADAVALWVAHTHATDAADSTPYLWSHSAERRSGKSRLLEVAELVVARPWPVVNPSEAVLYRKIARDLPTLLWDEVDTVFKRGRETAGLQSVLNSGFRRGVRVPRATDKGAIEEFEVFSAKAIAGIGGLPDTVADRCIPIRLQRRKSTEHVEKFRRREAEGEANRIREALEAWASETTIERLRSARPPFPQGMSDRAEDCWEPLLAVADLAGGAWPTRARVAASALQGEKVGQEETLGVQLLADVRTAFESLGVERIFTADLVSALREQGDGPWAAWWSEHEERDGYKAAGHRLRRLLKPFGIESRKLRIGDETRSGFQVEQFEDAWARYPLASLPSDSEQNNGTSQLDAEIEAQARSQSDTKSDLQGSVVPFQRGGEATAAALEQIQSVFGPENVEELD